MNAKNKKNGQLIISGIFKTIYGAEGFCRNNCLVWEQHRFPMNEAGR